MTYTVEKSKTGAFLVKSNDAIIATVADRGWAEYLADTYNAEPWPPKYAPRSDRRGPGRSGGRRHYDGAA